MIHDIFRRITARSIALPLLVAASALPDTRCVLPDAASSHARADGLIRHKLPDRGTYSAPSLPTNRLRPVNAKQAQSESAVTKKTSKTIATESAAPLVSAATSSNATSPGEASALTRLPEPVVLTQLDQQAATAKQASPVKQVTHQVPADVTPVAPKRFAEPAQASQLRRPVVDATIRQCSCASCQAGATSHSYDHGVVEVGQPVFDSGCDAGFCDSDCCDSGSCDSGYCGNSCCRFPWLRLNDEDWFGSAELMLMFRKGDRMPALATDGPLDSANPPQVFAGEENVYKDMSVGGRLTIGTWLDDCKDRHLVGRAWFAGEQTFGFNGDQNSHPTLVRPFFNVTDGLTADDDMLVVANFNQASGRLTIQGDSNVYGADLSIRQLWYKNCGMTVDLLYGYQYMGLDESLTIADRSVSLNDVPPIGSIRATTDIFDVENDFHGGQIGMATHYREGCWSFSSLAKVGFGSLRRRSVLTGSTFNSIDGNNATDPNGLLVRSTNAGTVNDDTFGWVPELDFTLGWQKYPCFDVTVGYHIIAMTDALQVSGVIDPNLAVNAAVPPTGLQRPSANFRHGTFYVQGIHFGISYIY